jgi:hypothetical protein
LGATLQRTCNVGGFSAGFVDALDVPAKVLTRRLQLARPGRQIPVAEEFRHVGRGHSGFLIAAARLVPKVRKVQTDQPGLAAGPLPHPPDDTLWSQMAVGYGQAPDEGEQPSGSRVTCSSALLVPRLRQPQRYIGSAVTSPGTRADIS